jgi:hypothetical protein
MHRSEYEIERLDATRFECRATYNRQLFVANRVSSSFDFDDL